MNTYAHCGRTEEENIGRWLSHTHRWRGKRRSLDCQCDACGVPAGMRCVYMGKARRLARALEG